MATLKNGFLYSNGNKKIGHDTVILNITSASNCPSDKLGLCKVSKLCYAKKIERYNPYYKPFCDRQTKQWDTLTAKQIVINILHIKDKNPDVKYLRYSEAGDFRTQEDINKMSDIAELLKPVGIRVYGYTARSDLDFSNVSDNMTVTGTYFNVHNCFKPVRQFTSKIRCQANCRTCNLCKNRNNKTIEVLIH